MHPNLYRVPPVTTRAKLEAELKFDIPAQRGGKEDQMVVRTLGNGREVTGIYVGAQNARRHFPREKKHVELCLGHLQIHCDLSPEFWNGRPEISDQRLGAWLYSRFFHGKASRAPMPIELVPAGEDAFRLVPFTVPPASTDAISRKTQPRRRNHSEKEKTRCANPLCFTNCVTCAPMMHH